MRYRIMATGDRGSAIGFHIGRGHIARTRPRTAAWSSGRNRQVFLVSDEAAFTVGRVVGLATEPSIFPSAHGERGIDLLSGLPARNHRW
jgi:hypothetical protein